MKRYLTLVIMICFIVLGLAAQNQGHPDGFVRINGGTFQMGSPSREPNRSDYEVQRRITVSSFYMGKFPVTQREWVEVMGTNPSHFRGNNLPVETVSWFDAIEYCNRRSIREGLTPAYTINGTTVTWNRNANGYRLPTEAEWEYACRAGTRTAFSTGNNITTNQANFSRNRERTTEAGSFPPNRWGLFDMHGNVWEWCWDWFIDYDSSVLRNPVGPSSGFYRVIRGGSWDDSVEKSRSANRYYYIPLDKFYHIGFRVVRDAQ
jgi:formylglycine-generating enzyme required for sulfatase activity